MNCLAIDDEPLALDVIEDFVGRVSFLKLMAKCDNAVEALNLMQKEPIDLIFLDIQMPDISGIDFLKSLGKAPLVIFTTAFSEYALDGFELNAVDYLVKPIAFERFLKAVSRAHEIYSLNQFKQKASKSSGKPVDEFIIVNADYHSIKINLNEIQYIEGLKDYVKIYTGPKPIMTLSTMKRMEDKLPADRFIRVHKSYIVAVPFIDGIEKNKIIIETKRIPIGEKYKEDFYRHMNSYRL
jgi:DNA-binding LytR/AlgR family response regulator